MLKGARQTLLEIRNRKQIPILIVDEAHLLRSEVFEQIHTLMQFNFDSTPIMPLIFCGQDILLDKLLYHSSRALASRIIGKTYLEALNIKAMTGYINHHIEVAGIKDKLFAEESILAIHQGSGGLLRKANILAQGALLAAAKSESHIVLPDHVRIASTEVI